MSSLQPSRKELFLLFAMVILAFAGAFVRLFFGVDVSDETLYVSEAHITLQGALPVINNWMQFAPFTFLNAPVLAVVERLCGGTAGVMLGMRIAYLLGKITLVAGMCLLLKRYFPAWMIAVCDTVCLIPVYGNISNLSYTSHSFYLLILSGVLMASAVLEKRACHKAFLLAVLSGICSAWCAGVYPTHVGTCALLALVLLVGEVRVRRSARLFAGYAVGGLGTAIAVVVYLSMKGGGLSSILFGIEQILSTGYFTARTRSAPMELVWSTLIVGASLIFWLVLFAFLILAGPIRKHLRVAHGGVSSLKSLDWPRLLFSYGWVAYLLNLLVGAVLYWFFPGSPFVSYHRTFLIQIVVPPYVLAPVALWLVKEKYPACKTLLATLWFPAGVWLVVTGLSVFDGYANRCIALLGGQFCFLLFSGVYVAEAVPAKQSARWRLGCTAACLCATVLSLYGFIYGDAPLSELTYRVESGVYQGLYTTETQAEGLPALETQLRQLLTEEDTVLFLDCAPMCYLMTDAQHCTATTWDTGYAGQTDAESRLHPYFALVEQLPEHIVYVDAGRYDQLSIDDEGYSLNTFVGEYYSLAYQNNDAVYPIRQYVRNETLWSPQLSN